VQLSSLQQTSHVVLQNQEKKNKQKKETNLFFFREHDVVGDEHNINNRLFVLGKRAPPSDNNTSNRDIISSLARIHQIILQNDVPVHHIKKKQPKKLIFPFLLHGSWNASKFEFLHLLLNLNFLIVLEHF
jgi:hypothetical protein